MQALSICHVAALRDECRSSHGGVVTTPPYTTVTAWVRIGRVSNEKKSWLRGVRDKIEGQIQNAKTQQAEGAAAAGNLVIQKSFGMSAIAIYDGGYVRVS